MEELTFYIDLHKVHQEKCDARKNTPAKSAIKGLTPSEHYRITEKK